MKAVTITADGRDAGKAFFLTEMATLAWDRWCLRALGALARSGVDLPPDILQAPTTVMFAIGIKALVAIHYDEAGPLLEELMACVVRIPDAGKPSVTRPIHETDIEEVQTFLTLRSEVFELHTGFSVTDGLSYLGSLVRKHATSSGNATETSPRPLVE